jgi:hypothetical protein
MPCRPGAPNTQVKGASRLLEPHTSNGRSVQLRVGLEAPVWNDVTGSPPPHFHPSGAASPEAMISYEGKPTIAVTRWFLDSNSSMPLCSPS